MICRFLRFGEEIDLDEWIERRHVVIMITPVAPGIEAQRPADMLVDQLEIVHDCSEREGVAVVVKHLETRIIPNII